MDPSNFSDGIGELSLFSAALRDRAIACGARMSGEQRDQVLAAMREIHARLETSNMHRQAVYHEAYEELERVTKEYTVVVRGAQSRTERIAASEDLRQPPKHP